MGRAHGKVAFITGAARGQGRSHAVRLAAEGADIIAVDICRQVSTASHSTATREDLAETVRQVEARNRRIVAAEADVRDFQTLKRVLDQGVAELGRLDIVSANAGIGSFGLAEELTEAAWTEVIDVNLTGAWHTAKAAVPHLKASGGGAIVLTSSGAGLRGYPYIAHYTAAKHGMVGLTRTLALELAPFGIRVNSVHPNMVNTPMLMNETTFRVFRPDLEHPSVEDFAVAARAMNALPIPWVEPEDITNALLFLASDEARYVTGAALPVDAGVLLK